MYSCTHWQAYSPECGSRTPYLWNLIHLTPAVGWYREQIIAALRRPIREESELGGFHQAFELASRFAEHGYDDARRAMYERLDRENWPDLEGCSDELIRLDGFDGLLYSLRRWNGFEHEETWVLRQMLEDVEKHDGAATLQFMESATERHPEIARFMARVREAETEDEQRRLNRKAAPSLDFAAVKRMIQEKTPRVNFGDWGKRADPRELMAAVDEILKEDDEEAVIRWLSVFRWREFPRILEPALERTHSRNEKLARRALAILVNYKDERVRRRALEVLTNPALVDCGIELLTNNFETGDFTLIQEAILRIEDENIFHWAAMDAKEVAKANPTTDAVGCLFYIYENGLCSICRGGVVKQLEAMGRLPEWMKSEFHFDCDQFAE